MSRRMTHGARRGFTRRGFALMVALWLVVAIATVGLQFGLEAREHRLLAMAASERGAARAAATGALALAQARLERALRQPTVRGDAAALRAADPWLDADSLLAGVDTLGGVTVEVRARDLGERLNLNQLGDEELRAFFGFLLDDYLLADELAAAVMDWRDTDDMARPRGGERAEYEREGRLVLPPNAPFRDVGELLHVRGMTPEILARAQPYLATRGSGRVNVNSASEAVLRAIPGITDDVVARILAWRSQGRRVRTLQEVTPAARGAQRNRMAQRATTDAREVELTLIARAGPQALPVRIQAVVTRGGGTSSTIAWKTWQ